MGYVRVRSVRSFPKRETVWLEFTRDEPRSGEYYVLGGITFPTSVIREDGPVSEGHLVTIGQFVESGEILVLAEMAYRSIGPRVDRGRVIDSGIAPHIMTMFSLYGNRRYFYNQPFDMLLSFLDATGADPDIPIRVAIEKIEWPDENVADEAIIEALGRGLKYDRHSIFAQALAGWQLAWGNLRRVTPPCIHALRCAIYALKKWPWTGHDQPYAVIE